ncbi:MAG TPA: carboxypeptidase-like regulatory domain-containing protein [Candidatus Dormibacteraeota bacterium]|nr:carboxypeptidase-like regulatory domain-containing protein [Candidatus Dormibacteraeota bacterium]
MRRISATVVVILCLALMSFSQTFRGAINGSVTDPSGAVVAGASVKATNVGTDVSIDATTTSDGQFAFQDLPLGTYKITVAAAGFHTTTVDKIEVTAGSAYTLPVKLTVGGTGTTAVEVSAAALTLDTTTAAQDNILPTESVQNVPMNGRDFTQFAAVQPGYGGYSVGGFGSLNGTRANQMNWQIDGVDNNDFWHNIPAVNQGGVSGIAGVIMPLDAIDEFAAQTNSNAEGGRNAGGIVNVVLKSGSNDIHGSAYYFNRNEAYGAASPFFNPSLLASEGLPNKKPPLRNQNYGFSLGGPIIKDKAFWFLSFEKQRYTIGLSGLNTEPSVAYQNAALELLSANGYTESSISANLIANVWPSLINNLPAQTGNYFATNPSIGYSYNGVAKIDYNFTERHHFSIRWFGGQGDQIAPLGGSAALATASSNDPFYFEKAPIHVYNYAATLNSVLSPKITNQILFGVNYFNQVFNDANHSFNTPAYGLDLSPDALINGKPILGAPNLQISGFEQVGITPPEGRNDITGMLTDIVSYNVGKHQFRFGGEFRQGHVDEFYYRHSLGSFIFDGTQGNYAACGTLSAVLCGDPNVASLADFLGGFVSSASIAVGDAERKVVVNGIDFFGQDSWQLTSRLNINWGLRWDYFGPLHNGSKDLAVFVPGSAMQIQGGGISNVFTQDKNNIAPRFGFAYKPTNRDDIVVRGGFGVFYDQINMNPFLDFRPPNGGADGLEDNPAGPKPVSVYSLGPSTALSGGNPAAGGYTWQPNAAIFPGVSTCVTGVFTAGSTDCTDPSTGASTIFNVFSVNQNFRTPYFFNYNLNIEKSFGNGVGVFQLGYVGSEGRKLSVLLDINQVGGTFTDGAYPQYPNFGSINQLNSIGTSNYNALQSTLRLRAWHGLTTQIAYTWAHELDEISAYRGAIPYDSTNLKAEYGNGDFDTRQNLSLTLNWNVPGSSHGPQWLSHGWAVNSLMTFHGGQPLDEFRTGYDIIGNPFSGVSHAFSKSGVTWINPAAFCLPAVDDSTGKGGNCPASAPEVFGGSLRRNQIYGPGFSDVDLSVFKNIPITERFKAQFRVELFNTFNRINLASGVGATGPGSGVIADTIGDFNGAPGIGPGEAFNMQLGLKILF